MTLPHTNPMVPGRDATYWRRQGHEGRMAELLGYYSAQGYTSQGVYLKAYEALVAELEAERDDWKAKHERLLRDHLSRFPGTTTWEDES